MKTFNTERKFKHSKNVSKEKYKTNHSPHDARYIFDWDDYIEDRRTGFTRETKIESDFKFKLLIG